MDTSDDDLGPSGEADDVLDRFCVRYSVPASEAAARVERAVIGGDWGANGYTTMAQADRMAEMLDLETDDRLLDIGSGRGWPGLYLAATSGCSVVVTDLPREGLRTAAERAVQERLGARAQPVLASAAGPPFRTGAFDAVIHADVLC